MSKGTKKSCLVGNDEIKKKDSGDGPFKARSERTFFFIFVEE
jgi:hypothetical protein